MDDESGGDESDGLTRGVDSRDGGVMHIWMSNLWMSKMVITCLDSLSINSKMTSSKMALGIPHCYGS